MFDAFSQVLVFIKDHEELVNLSALEVNFLDIFVGILVQLTGKKFQIFRDFGLFWGASLLGFIWHCLSLAALVRL
jgi:hypothetical protein